MGKIFLTLAAVVLVVLTAAPANAQLYPTPGRDPMAPPVRKPHDPTPPNPPVNSGPSDFQQTQNDLRRREVVKNQARVLYRGPTEEESAAIAVTAEELAAYTPGGSLSGVFRLIVDQGCEEANKGELRESACSRYSMPGNGSSYSFREKNYRISRLADLRYLDNLLRAGSRFTMGILGRLDQEDLGAISIDTEGVRQVASLPAPKDLGQVENLYYKLESGFTISGHRYSNMLSLSTEGVYVLRSIAFNRPNPQTVQDITYDESEYDKRVDIVVVFRAVRGLDSRSVIVFWKELRSQDAPKLKDKKE